MRIESRTNGASFVGIVRPTLDILINIGNYERTEFTIRLRIDQYAARLATTPRALKTSERRELLRELKASGCMEIRRAADTIAAHLGVYRATVYSDAR